MIIDLDSHLREGYFMDEVYNLPESRDQNAADETRMKWRTRLFRKRKKGLSIRIDTLA